MTSLMPVYKFFIIGDKYLIPKIEDIAKAYVKSLSFTDDIVYDAIQNYFFSNSIFADKVNSYIMENAHRLVTSEKFLNVPETFVHHILQMDRLNIREYQLLLAVTKWAYRNIKKANSENLINFYKYIIFSSLGTSEFFQFIDLYPEAIDEKSSLKILQHIHNPSRHSLPNWSSINRVIW